MPFDVVSGVGRGMGILDGVEIVEGEGHFRGNCGASHCNQWGLCCVVVRNCVNWSRCHLEWWFWSLSDGCIRWGPQGEGWFRGFSFFLVRTAYFYHTNIYDSCMEISQYFQHTIYCWKCLFVGFRKMLLVSRLKLGFTRNLQKCNTDFNFFTFASSKDSSSKVHVRYWFFRWLLIYKPKLLAKNFGLYINSWHSASLMFGIARNTQLRLARWRWNFVHRKDMIGWW